MKKKALIASIVLLVAVALVSGYFLNKKYHWLKIGADTSGQINWSIGDKTTSPNNELNFILPDATDNADSYYISPENKKIIDNIWSNRKQYFINQMHTRLAKGDTYILYDVETYTVNLLEYAILTKDYQKINDLAEIYLTAYPYLKTDTDGHQKWIQTDTTNPELNSLLGKEVDLCVFQFLYPVSKTINAINNIDSSQRTATMNDFVAKMTPVALDHYDVRGQAWLPTIQNSLNSPNPPDYIKYHNAITDHELWLVSGLIEFLAAEKKETNVSISDSQKQLFQNLISAMIGLTQKRTSQSSLTDFSGQSVVGTNLDLGAWDNYLNDNAYSGYTGDQFPGWTDPNNKTPAIAPPPRATNVGWDISHARRFVYYFDTLYENKDITGSTFPNKATMQGLANQFIYGAFNKDSDKPLFANFMDGTNGWFRVNYASRPSFGYALSTLSNSAPTGGYGFWSQFNNDIFKVLTGLWGKLVFKDDSGKNNFCQSAGKISQGEGVSGQGLQFSATTSSNFQSYLSCALVDNQKSSTGAIGLWFETGNKGEMQDLLEISSAPYYKYLLVRIIDNDHIGVYLENDDSSHDDLVTLSYVANTPNVEDGNWHYLALTQDGTGLKIYLDGQEKTATVSNKNMDVAFWLNSFNLPKYFIGATHWRSFNGSLDEIEILDRALSPGEISQYYADKKPITSDNVLALWNFDKTIPKGSFGNTYYAGDFANINDSLSLLMYLPSLLQQNLKTLTYSASNLPSGATFDANARQFKWTPTAEQVGEYTVDFTVSDGFYSNTQASKITITKPRMETTINTIITTTATTATSASIASSSTTNPTASSTIPIITNPTTAVTIINPIFNQQNVPDDLDLTMDNPINGNQSDHSSNNDSWQSGVVTIAKKTATTTTKPKPTTTTTTTTRVVVVSTTPPPANIFAPIETVPPENLDVLLSIEKPDGATKVIGDNETVVLNRGYKLLFSGKFKPNEKIIVTIHSDPQSFVFEADKNGDLNGEIVLNGIEDGEHQVTIQSEANALAKKEFKLNLLARQQKIAEANYKDFNSQLRKEAYWVYGTLIFLILLTLGYGYLDWRRRNGY